MNKVNVVIQELYFYYISLVLRKGPSTFIPIGRTLKRGRDTCQAILEVSPNDADRANMEKHIEIINVILNNNPQIPFK